MSKSGVFSIKKWLFFVVIFLLIGCSTNRLPNIEVIDKASVAQSRKSSQTPQEALTLAEQDIEIANKEALEYYAPIHLSLAEKYLKNAQSLFLKDTDPIAVIAETIKVRKVIADGLSTKQSVLRQLSDLFKMKERLEQLKTEVYFRDDYDDQLENIKKLIRYIEKGDQEAFDKKKSVYFDKMLALEIDVVKKKALSKPLQIFKNAKRINAKKYAPKTWKTAEDSLTQARFFIESFPRDEAGVEKVGLEALRACQHAYFVTKEVLHIEEIDEDDIENLILEIESKLNRITLALNHADVRYMSLHDQSVALANAAETLGRNLIFCNRKEMNTQALEKTVSELDSVKAEEETQKDITDDIIPVLAQEPEVSETLASDSINEKQEPISTGPDGFDRSDAGVIKDDLNDNEKEAALSGTVEEAGKTSDSNDVESMGAGDETPEIKPETEEITQETAQLTEPHDIVSKAAQPDEEPVKATPVF